VCVCVCVCVLIYGKSATVIKPYSTTITCLFVYLLLYWYFKTGILKADALVLTIANSGIIY